MALRNSNGRFRKRGSFDNKQFSVNTLSQGIANFEFKMNEGFENAILDFKEELVSYARSNAPWEDRTGDARGGLASEFYGEAGQTVGVVLYHTVDYGPWLEIRWGGKYAIIMPTVEAMGTKMLGTMQRMMDGITFYE